ncbi:sugar ABC transporter ATP-binding protein [Georgenia yuyongxinii]|uniref:Sugar ABC transporter ATP-binding protein n=1 Tax=Georgenia yuyongxinii TaxID=2589797 RepID=A0A552WT58_9MICO|nr:sugar ABC transporter ATP-binding protein [Georgenia yuyongxinii]TRW45875.1 sugar ABC transporter ATP-binding protein [Georgenia yuyongxinii]
MTNPAHAGTTAPVLEVRDIVKTFGGVTALGGVSLELRPGEVLCLAGENGCGKSTLIKIISGAEKPDSGSIIVDGEQFTSMDTTDALKSGIQVIYQDFSLFPNLTVAENIVLTSAVAARQRLFNGRASRPAAQQIVDDLGLTLDLDAEVSALPVADKQLTAICRALVHEARVIIMDEPTTALTQTEVGRLFAIVEALRARGVAFIFVSHKLDEVLALSDRVAILRSGRNVITSPAAELDLRTIAQHMTGQVVDDSRRVSELAPEAPPVLEVEHLTLPGAYHDVSFTLRRGEILGLTGLLGSGRTEIAESLFGVHPYESGTVKVDGVPTRLRSIDDAIAAGVGYVPEDRLTQGLFLEKSIADNMVASSTDQHRTRWLTLNKRAIRRTINSLFGRLRIKAPNVQAPVRSLSGGNAQRVVLAKWLARRPKVLMLNGPTVGVDVGSKSEILDILRAQAAEGMGVIVISDDAPELVASCHRVLVVRHGRVVDLLEGDEIGVESIRKKVAA